MGEQADLRRGADGAVHGAGSRTPKPEKTGQTRLVVEKGGTGVEDARDKDGVPSGKARIQN